MSWSSSTLYLAPNQKTALAVLGRVERGRVWLADEVRALAERGATPEDVRAVGEAKLIFNGAALLKRSAPVFEPFLAQPVPNDEQRRGSATKGHPFVPAPWQFPAPVKKSA